MGVLSSELARFPAASPSRPSERTRDKLRSRKHGTTDRLALPHQYRLKGEIAETVRSAPGRDPRMARFIRILSAMARESDPSARPGRTGNLRRLDTSGPCGGFRPNFSGFQRPGALMTAAFTFPGQGSQAVGMGKALAEAFPAARAVFEEVDAALGEKLTATIWEGPAETLQLTENAQPALMAVSLATLRVLETEAGFSVGRDAAFVAGHSLGEYSALAAAGSFSISDTARLLRTRGLAMQKAVPVGAGAMAALLGRDYEAAVAVANEAAQGQVCQAASDNGGGQVVVSGDKAAVERALEIAKTKGAKRAMLLPVSAPFHCKLMQPAADAMAK